MPAPAEPPFALEPSRVAVGRRVFLRRGVATAGAALGGAAAWQVGQARADVAWLERPGVCASLEGRRIFPADDPWNLDVSSLPVDPRSAALAASIGLDEPIRLDLGRSRAGDVWGIPYLVVSGQTTPVDVRFDYADESDPGPYPVPLDAPIEGGPAGRGDRHVLVVDSDAWQLYELFAARPQADHWQAGSGAVFDLERSPNRPAGWTSADAAGLPILPGLVRYDEVFERGEIAHALRFTVKRSRRAYLAPATHFASKHRDPNLPPMGLRVRLKADVDLSRLSREAQVVARALQRYGMLLADNGMNWMITGTTDLRWPADFGAALRRLRGRDFEVVAMNPAALTVG